MIPCLPKIFWFFYRKPWYFLILIPSFINGFISIGKTASIAYAIDAINQEEGIQYIKKFAFYQFILGSFSGFLSALSYYLWHQVNSLIRIKMKCMVFKSMMMKDVEFFDRHNFGELLSILNDDVKKAEHMFSAGMAREIASIGKIISGLFYCFSLEWRLTLFAILMTLVQTPITRIFTHYGRKIMKIGNQANEESLTIASESISNIRSIFSFNRQYYELDRYLDEINTSCQCDFQTDFAFSISGHLSSMLNNGALCVFLNIGSFFILTKTLTPGFLFSLSIEAFNLAKEINSCIINFTKDQKYLLAADRIFHLIETPSSVPFTEEGRVISDFKGNIEFQGVWFRYPTRDSWVLKNISFTVPENEIVAIVGHSGSGKSTILQLILRFYDANGGQIFLDGIDIQDLDPRWIHRVISVVQQDTTLFSMSIRDNILYGLNDFVLKSQYGITHLDAANGDLRIENDIQNCLQLVQASDFVNQLPFNINTIVGEKGSELSGGQRQRIAIARSIIRDPKILITDEATSALDSENENKVQSALNEVMKGRTSLIIAHRLGTISAAHLIIVFQDGEIVEQGTHQELIQKKGAFYHLIEQQLCSAS